MFLLEEMGEDAYNEVLLVRQEGEVVEDCTFVFSSIHTERGNLKFYQKFPSVKST